MTQTPASFTLNDGSTPAEQTYNRYVTQVYAPRVTAISKALDIGKISVGDWLRAMLVEVDFVIFTAVQLGRGGTDKLTDADLLYIRRVTADQRTYLRKWAEQIGAAIAIGVVVSAASLLTRALKYAQTAQSFLMVAYTLAMGMPLLPAYPKDWTSECKSGDRCRWIIKKVGPNSWDCYWEIDFGAESCITCVNRWETWYPLKIVDGVIESYDPTGLFV